jgi:hypothetical protein
MISSGNFRDHCIDLPLASSMFSDLSGAGSTFCDLYIRSIHWISPSAFSEPVFNISDLH